MISLRTVKECESLIPQLVWPVEFVEISESEGFSVKLHAELPWWSYFALGLLHWKCKREIESLCKIHGLIHVTYNINVS